MIDFVGTFTFMRIPLRVATETQKIPFPLGIFLRTFFYETGHLPDTKTVVNISQGISCGKRVIFG